MLMKIPKGSPRYVSTRGSGESVSFREALLSGLAPDGGLYIPDYIPRLPESVWTCSQSLPDMAFHVLHPWLSEEVAEESLRDILQDALSFPVPLVPLTHRDWDGVFVLELFHGPTLSFKDFGARVMARLMAHFLQGDGVTILVATSGDTGSAVADGFAGREGLRVALLYPNGQVSPTQERQLILRRPGVRPFAVSGSFDDCQRMVKAALVDKDLSWMRLSAANSINVGRLLPQMLYYAWAVLVGDLKDTTMCVPSGNLGSLTGGVLAAFSGLPVRDFLAAHNSNDGFPRYLEGAPFPFSASVRTLSNAMDVGRPSNFERISALLPRAEISRWIRAETVDDDATQASVRRVYEDTGYVADPHTAVGLEATRRYRKKFGDHRPCVVLATAHPAKFPEALSAALGFAPEVPSRLAALRECPTAVVPLAATDAAFRDVLLAWT